MNSAKTSLEKSTPRSVSRNRAPSRASRPGEKALDGLFKLEPLFGQRLDALRQPQSDEEALFGGIGGRGVDAGRLAAFDSST